MWRSVVVSLYGLAILACSTPAGARPSPDVPREVAVTGTATSDYAFAPASVSVVLGTTVQWTNPTAVGHTVTFTDSFDPPRSNDTFNELIGSTASVPRTFSAPGTYLYFCSVHPTMRGSIVVAGR